MLGLMLATVAHPDLHRELTGHLALAWPDLEALRLWRIPASSLAQEDGGMAWPIVALLAALVLAERRYGGVRALVCFFAADALSSVPALAVVELSGSSEAPELAGEPNLGSSSGLIGALAAWAAGAPRRTRRVAVVVIGAGLAANIAVERDLTSVQHTLAALAGYPIGRAFRMRSGSSDNLAGIGDGRDYHR